MPDRINIPAWDTVRCSKCGEIAPKETAKGENGTVGSAPNAYDKPAGKTVGPLVVANTTPSAKKALSASSRQPALCPKCALCAAAPKA